MIALVLAVACSGGSETPAAPPPSRFDAVLAKPRSVAADAAAFCEGQTAGAAPAVFQWPTLDGATPAAAPGWTWVNVWATWCAPCVEEMPRLQAWESKLTEEVGPGALRFLSVDATAGAVSRFAEHHPDVRMDVRIADFDDLAGWLPTIGLDAGAVLPIHVLLDGAQQIRCVREGAISAGDYDVVKAVLAGF